MEGVRQSPEGEGMPGSDDLFRHAFRAGTVDVGTNHGITDLEADDWHPITVREGAQAIRGLGFGEAEGLNAGRFPGRPGKTRENRLLEHRVHLVRRTRQAEDRSAVEDRFQPWRGAVVVGQAATDRRSLGLTKVPGAGSAAPGGKPLLSKSC